MALVVSNLLNFGNDVKDHRLIAYEEPSWSGRREYRWVIHDPLEKELCFGRFFIAVATARYA